MLCYVVFFHVSVDLYDVACGRQQSVVDPHQQLNHDQWLAMHCLLRFGIVTIFSAGCLLLSFESQCLAYVHDRRS